MSMDSTPGLQLPEGLLPAIPDIASNELVMIFIHPNTDRVVTSLFIKRLQRWTVAGGALFVDMREATQLPPLDEEVERMRGLRQRALENNRPCIVAYRHPMRFTRMAYEADICVHCLPGYEGVVLQTSKSRRYPEAIEQTAMFKDRKPALNFGREEPKRLKDMRMIRIDVSGYVQAGCTTVATMITQMLAEKFPERLVQLKNEGDALNFLGPRGEAPMEYDIHARRFMVVDMNNRNDLDPELFVSDRDERGFGTIYNTNLPSD